VVDAWYHEREDDERNAAQVGHQLEELRAAGWDKPAQSPQGSSSGQSLAVAATQ